MSDPVVNTRLFGSVPQLGLGYIFADVEPQKKQGMMERLLDEGLRLVDTAQCYPGHEEFLGTYMAHRRDDMVLVSKCGHHDVRPDGSMRSRKISMEDIDLALSKCRCDYLDAMLLHSYDLSALKRGEALTVLHEAKRAGKIRALGYSGDGASARWALEQGEIDVLECSLNLVDQANTELLPLAVEKGVLVIAKRPLANAAWQVNECDAHESVKSYVRRFAKMPLDPSAFGSDDMGELALRFVISLSGAPVAIVGSASVHHQNRNLRAWRKGKLTTERMQALTAAFCTSRGDEPWPAQN